MLGLDIGEKRVGVALSDPDERVATPLCVLDASVLRDASRILDLVSEYDVGRLVIGLPISLDGSEGPQAARVREVGTRLAEATGMVVDYADERLSSAEASRTMRASGLSEKERRGRLDMVAAALFLQSYLDRRAEATSQRAMPEEAGTPAVDDIPHVADTREEAR